MIDLAALDEGTELIDPVEAMREEWLLKRLGKITCSKFGDLMGIPKIKGELFTQTAKAYLNRVVAERLGSWHSISARSMDWGNENEPLAIAEYAALTGYAVDSKSFRFFELSDDVGGTPDGLIALDGCLEIKCPYDPSVHVNTMLTRRVPSEYEWQVVGHLLVTGRSWCDFVSYDPRVTVPKCRLAVIRVERNDTALSVLQNRLSQAVEYVRECVAELTSTAQDA